MGPDRQAALNLIRRNIDAHGHHVYRLLGGELPQFSYTIGLSPRIGFEILLAGAAWYSGVETVNIINELAKSMIAADFDGRDRAKISFGEFSLRTAHTSWSHELALGAFDFYQRQDIPIRQVVPPSESCTLDVPDMTRAWNPQAEPVWRCLREPWPFNIPSDSTAVTNLRAMRGEAVTEGVRRKEQAWELFADANPDVPQDEVLVVPLGTLLLADASLEPFTKLAVGAGLKRVAGGAWRSRGST